MGMDNSTAIVPSLMELQLTAMCPKCYCPLLFGEQQGVPRSQFEALQVGVNTRGPCANSQFSQGKSAMYASWVKIGLEKDLKSVWTKTDHTHRIILTIWASDERQNANLVHLSVGNKAFQEQARSWYKVKVDDGNSFESRFCNASHHFWSQKSGNYRQELSVFPREN